MKIDKDRYHYINAYILDQKEILTWPLALAEVTHSSGYPLRDNLWGMNVADYWAIEAEEVVSAWAQRTEGVVTDIDGSRWDFIHGEVFASAWERSD